MWHLQILIGFHGIQQAKGSKSVSPRQMLVSAHTVQILPSALAMSTVVRYNSGLFIDAIHICDDRRHVVMHLLPFILASRDTVLIADIIIVINSTVCCV